MSEVSTEFRQLLLNCGSTRVKKKNKENNGVTVTGVYLRGSVKVLRHSEVYSSVSQEKSQSNFNDKTKQTNQNEDVDGFYSAIRSRQ